MVTEEEVLELENQLKGMQIDNANSEKVGQLKKKIKQLNFRKKHKKLFGLTMGLGRGTKRMFKGIGSGIKAAAKGIEKSDAFIAEQQRKERALSKGKPKKKMSMLEEAGDID